MIDGVVAIVGRPNVGKSTIFNRIIGERLSIVEDSPGVTRDRIYAKANWLTKDFRLIDTGGIQVENATFQEEIRVQVDIAIDEADVILFIVNDGFSVLQRPRAGAGRLEIVMFCSGFAGSSAQSP